jgi:hypothetical protein
MNRIKLLFAVFSFALLTGCSDAELTPVGTSDSSCVIKVDGSDSSGLGIGVLNESLGGWSLAQSFELTADKEFTSIYLKLGRKGLPSGTVTLSIEGSSGSTPLPDGVVVSGTNSEQKTYLASTTFSATVNSAQVSNLETSADFILFTFSEKIALKRDTTYWIVVSASYAKSDDDYIFWEGTTTNPYTSGQGKYEFLSDNNWESNFVTARFDYYFKLGCS